MQFGGVMENDREGQELGKKRGRLVLGGAAEDAQALVEHVRHLNRQERRRNDRLVGRAGRPE